MHIKLVIGSMLVLCLPVQDSHGAFTSGSAYRHNWGYKRSSDNDDNWKSYLRETMMQRQRDQFHIPVIDVVERLSTDNELAFHFVSTFLDSNGDGFVSEEDFLR